MLYLHNLQSLGPVANRTLSETSFSHFDEKRASRTLTVPNYPDKWPSGESKIVSVADRLHQLNDGPLGEELFCFRYLALVQTDRFENNKLKQVHGTQPAKRDRAAISAVHSHARREQLHLCRANADEQMED